MCLKTRALRRHGRASEKRSETGQYVITVIYCVATTGYDSLILTVHLPSPARARLRKY